MGGKHNLASRTKNNARPSSSGRSAAMLNSTLPQFGGFSCFKDSSGLSSFAFSPIEEFDSSVEENFQLVIKKISKKDSTTKLKGLQELIELVQNAKPEVVKAILPIWPRLYSVLATDPENRIREATHHVHHKIVIKVKRNIAPYLKQLIAPWFTSQYDNYPPAATAAVQAFKDVFSEAKFEEAIIFCQDEILCYIYDILSIQMDKNMPGNTNLTQEEAEEKYERMLISCLQGYALYLQKVPEGKIKDFTESNLKIVLNKRFWKLVNSTTSLLRTAWFQVLSVILQKALFLLKDKEAQVLNTTLNYLEDDDPLVVTYVWECLLLTTSVIPNCWNNRKVENLLIPKLIKLLQQAGKGNARIIYPNLLPLLSYLSTVKKEDATQFYNNFFDAMRYGLKLKSKTNSKSELTAIMGSFVECLQFLIIKNSSDMDLCKSLIKNQLLLTIEWCISDDVSYYKIIFYQTSVFVQYLGCSNNSDLLEILTIFFFENIHEMISVLLQPNCINCCNMPLILEKQIELMRSLKQMTLPKKIGRVKFVLKDYGKIHCSQTKYGSIIQNETYFQFIEQLAVRIFLDYARYITINSSKDLVDKLYSLVKEFDNNIFFESIRGEMNKNAKLLDIYENFFKKWLRSEEIYCKSVIHLIFLLMTCLQDHEQEIVLNDLLTINQPDCLMWSISTAILYPHIENTVVQKWLKEDKIGLFFISVVEKQVSSECSSELGQILEQALTTNRNRDLFITENILNQIIEKISCTLLNNEVSETLDSCSSLAVHLCRVIYTETLLLTYGDKLLITLIEVTCKFGTEKDNFSLETSSKIKSAWQDGLVILLNNLEVPENQNLVEKIAVTIENQFLETSVTNKKQMEHLADVIVICVRAFYKSTSPITTLLMELIFKRPWIVRKEVIIEVCKAAEYIKGNMNSEFSLHDLSNEREILQCFTWCFIKLYALCSKLNIEQIDSQECTNKENYEGRPQDCLVNIVNTAKNYLLEALHFYTVGESFLIHFNNVKYYKEILYYNSWIGEKLKEAYLLLNKNELRNVEIELQNKCLHSDFFWCKTIFTFYIKILEMNDYSLIHAKINEIAPNNNLIRILHNNQIFEKGTAEDVIEMPNKIVHDADDHHDNRIKEWVDQMEKLRQANMTKFSYDNSDNISFEEANKMIGAVRLCSNFIKYCPLTRTYWDFIVISLSSWVSYCLKARNLIENSQFQSILISVTELYIDICKRVVKFKEENVNISYVNEWEDVLLEDIHADFAQIWLFLSERLSIASENTISNLPLIQYFGPVTEYLKFELIFKSKDNFPKWITFLRRSCCLLTNSQTALQLWGYRMLKNLIPGLVKIDVQAVNSRTPTNGGLIFEQFKEKFIHVQDVVNSMLMDVKIGENTCKVEPSYDSFTYTIAYLLLWDIMLCLCEQSSPELRYQYADWLKNDDILHVFMSNLFKLISPEIYQNNEGKTNSIMDYFLKAPLDFTCYNKSCDSETIEQIACYLYKTALVQLPALVRQWWTDLDMKASQLVDKITTLYVSPHLCFEELNDVMNHQTIFKNMKVKVMFSIREILAIYTVDETQMELTITLPVNFPLGSLTIQCNKQISCANQKQWLLQFKKCVLHQNGRIWDGLALWNNNLDRKFDGVEECFICYAVLHFGTCQLPRLSCQTCKKKFHSACLYKWFSTSNKSSCPICRNLF